MNEENQNNLSESTIRTPETEPEKIEHQHSETPVTDLEVPVASEEESTEEEIIRLPVKTSSFTGPLELLVDLIIENKMDVFTVSLSTITDEYLKTLKSWQVEDLDIAGEYLVLAATLIRMKARALLPKEEQEKIDLELSDDILELRRLEYERFRQLAEELRYREQQSSSLYRRVGPSPEGPKEVFEYTEVSVYDLYRTFQKIIEEVGRLEPPTLKNESYSVDEKMMEIEALIAHNQKIILTDYLRTLESKLEIIVVFMALLELIRLKEIKAQQDMIHGEILIIKGEKPIPSPEGESDDGMTEEMI